MATIKLLNELNRLVDVDSALVHRIIRPDPLMRGAPNMAARYEMLDGSHAWTMGMRTWLVDGDPDTFRVEIVNAKATDIGH